MILLYIDQSALGWANSLSPTWIIQRVVLRYVNERSKLKHKDTRIVSAPIAESMRQKRLCDLLAALTILAELYCLLVLAHVPQAVTGHHQVERPLVDLELLVVWNVAHSVRLQLEVSQCARDGQLAGHPALDDGAALAPTSCRWYLMRSSSLGLLTLWSMDTRLAICLSRQSTARVSPRLAMWHMRLPSTLRTNTRQQVEPVSAEFICPTSLSKRRQTLANNCCALPLCLLYSSRKILLRKGEPAKGGLRSNLQLRSRRGHQGWRRARCGRR
jgi:hypothetical protein